MWRNTDLDEGEIKADAKGRKQFIERLHRGFSR